MTILTNPARLWPALRTGAVACLCLGICSGCALMSKMPWRAPSPVLLGPREVVPPPFAEPVAVIAPEPIVETMDIVTPPVEDFSVEPLVPVQDPDIVPALPPSDKVDIVLPPDVPSERIKYTVKKGDTLWDIALMYGVTHQELAAENNIAPGDEKRLKLGAVLTIPPGGRFVPPEDRPKPKPPKEKAGSSKAPTSTTGSSSKSGKVKRVPRPADGKYAVRPGDSLWVLARRFGTTTEALRTLNSLPNDTIHPGQVLIIPEDKGSSSAPSGTPDKPKKPKKSVKTNGSTEAAGTGQTSVVTPPPPTPAAGTQFDKILEHTVSQDETLEIIAEMYDTSVSDIKAANPGIKKDADLRPNMKISVPYH